jgi:hypothetical protein
MSDGLIRSYMFRRERLFTSPGEFMMPSIQEQWLQANYVIAGNLSGPSRDAVVRTNSGQGDTERL